MNWDPLHELVAFHDRAHRRRSSHDAAWVPSVDLLETSATYLVVVELPGLSADDFSIEATPHGLVLSGQRRPPVPVPERYLRMERGYGRFGRSFSFSEAIVVAGISASLERGLLRITVPKAAAADRRIEIG